MPILTDQILASGISLDDVVHIARPTDLSQSYNGSSYKATISQLIDSESCCLTNGFYTLSAGTIDFSGLSNVYEFSITGITFFTGGSSNCINNFYLNNILPCDENISIQPVALNGKHTYFGSNNAFNGFDVEHLTDNNNVGGPSYNFTRLNLNRGNGIFYDSYSTLNLKSYDKLTQLYLYDKIGRAHV